ncbi:hypothetical protein MBLNU457_2271t1 [Dothideomycetes sp. NU457]
MDTVPFSPQIPITPPLSPPNSFSSSLARKETISTTAPPPPKDPLAWLWQCHLCHRTYRLGVTRRCLDDGHRFCSGVTVLARKGSQTKVKRHKACASEFDYQGWATWGDWRRTAQEIDELETAAVKSCVSPLFGREKSPDVSPTTTTAPSKKNCERNCNYPSECRWGRKIVPPLVPSVASVKTADGEDITVVKTESPLEFASILIALEEESAPLVPTAEQSPNETACDDPRKENVLHSVVVSAKHRKRKSLSNVSSPLSPVVVDAEDADVGGETKSESQSSFAKVLDDFEIEMRKSLGRANDLLVGAIGGWRSRSPSPVKREEKREKTRESARSAEGSRRTKFVEGI